MTYRTLSECLLFYTSYTKHFEIKSTSKLAYYHNRYSHFKLKISNVSFSTFECLIELLLVERNNTINSHPERVNYN